MSKGKGKVSVRENLKVSHMDKVRAACALCKLLVLALY